MTVLQLRQIVPGAVGLPGIVGGDGRGRVRRGRLRPDPGRPIGDSRTLARALDVVVMWDTWNAWQPASSDHAAGR